MNLSATSPQPAKTYPAPRTGLERGLQAAASCLRQAWQGWTGALARFCGVNAALLTDGSRRREEADSGERDGFRLLTSSATGMVGLGLLVLAGVVGRPAAWAQAGPQDNWVYEGKRLLGDFRGICVGRDDLVYVGTNNGNGTYDVLVLDRNLNYLRKLTGTNTPFGTICGMACDSQTNIYILEPSRIKKFDAQGNSVLAWGSEGNGDGQFQARADGFAGDPRFHPAVYSLAIDSMDELYVADQLNSQIQVFTSQGQFVRKWGESGRLARQFDQFTGIAILPGDGVATAVRIRGDVVNDPKYAYQEFTREGSPARRFEYVASDRYYVSTGGGDRFDFAGDVWLGGMATSPDGVLVQAAGSRGDQYAPDRTDRVPYLITHNRAGALLHQYSLDGIGDAQTATLGVKGTGNRAAGWGGLGMGRTGAIYGILLGYPDANQTPLPSGLYVFERKYSADRPLIANTVPQPVLISSAQRAGTTLIDIDFKVIDADSTNVSVGLLGFANGGTSLNDLVLMTNFVGSTAGKLGTNVPANVTHRVTWDTATDWNVGIGNIQFEVLAKDERGLNPFRFISIPTNAANPTPLQISDTPLTDKQQFHIWNWLLATQDPRVRFVTTNTFVEIPKIFVPGDLGGERGLFEARRSVFGTVGGYAQVQLAATPSRRLPFVNEPYDAFAYSFGDPSAAPDITLPAGRAFLLELLGVRNPTAAEVSRANAGRYGFPAAVTTNHVVKLLP